MPGGSVRSSNDSCNNLIHVPYCLSSDSGLIFTIVTKNTGSTDSNHRLGSSCQASHASNSCHKASTWAFLRRARVSSQSRSTEGTRWLRQAHFTRKVQEAILVPVIYRNEGTTWFQSQAQHPPQDRESSHIIAQNEQNILNFGKIPSIFALLSFSHARFVFQKKT